MLEATAEIEIFYHNLFLEKPEYPFHVMPPPMITMHPASTTNRESLFYSAAIMVLVHPL